jgi:hypothetical protein
MLNSIAFDGQFQSKFAANGSGLMPLRRFSGDRDKLVAQSPHPPSSGCGARRFRFDERAQSPCGLNSEANAESGRRRVESNRSSPRRMHRLGAPAVVRWNGVSITGRRVHAVFRSFCGHRRRAVAWKDPVSSGPNPAFLTLGLYSIYDAPATADVSMSTGSWIWTARLASREQCCVSGGNPSDTVGKTGAGQIQLKRIDGPSGRIGIQPFVHAGLDLAIQTAICLAVLYSRGIPWPQSFIVAALVAKLGSKVAARSILASASCGSSSCRLFNTLSMPACGMMPVRE